MDDKEIIKVDCELIRDLKREGKRAEAYELLKAYHDNKKTNKKQLQREIRNTREKIFRFLDPEGAYKSQRGYRTRYPERIKEQGKRYREKHKEEIKERCKANREKYNEYHKEYYRKNSEKILKQIRFRRKNGRKS